MRHFFISYYHSNSVTRLQGYGQVAFSLNKYPSVDDIRSHIEDDQSLIIVMNIIELNESDYEDFITVKVNEKDGFEEFKKELFNYMSTKFNFTNEMIENSIIMGEKLKNITLQDLYDQNKTIAEVIEIIWGLKIEQE